MKFLVIGGNAAGMSAASRVKRKSPDTEVVVLEQTHEVSYGACGLPYYVAGLNNNLDLMRIRKADQFLANGVDLRLGCDVTGADFTAKTVSYTDENGEAHVESYDKLLIATGSSPKVPPIPGIRQKNIFPLKTLDQAAALKLALESNPKSVVIVGGGYIGLELAEACILQMFPRFTSSRRSTACSMCLTRNFPKWSRRSSKRTACISTSASASCPSKAKTTR